MRSTFLISVGLSALFPSGIAQSEEVQFLPRLWDFYQERCGQALSDPSNYLSSLVIPGPDGGRVLASTPDKQIVQVVTGRLDLQESYFVVAVGSKRMHICRVVGSDYSEIGPSETIEAELKVILRANPEILAVGGSMPHDLYFGSEIGPEEVTSIDDAYTYVLDGAHPNPNVITEVSFAEGEVELTGFLFEAFDN